MKKCHISQLEIILISPSVILCKRKSSESARSHVKLASLRMRGLTFRKLERVHVSFCAAYVDFCWCVRKTLPLTSRFRFVWLIRPCESLSVRGSRFVNELRLYTISFFVTLGRAPGGSSAWQSFRVSTAETLADGDAVEAYQRWASPSLPG